MLPSVVNKVDGEESQIQSVFEDSDYLNVIIRNPIPNLTNNVTSASLKIQFLDENTGEIKSDSVKLLYQESGFALNFVRSLGVILRG